MSSVYSIFEHFATCSMRCSLHSQCPKLHLIQVLTCFLHLSTLQTHCCYLEAALQTQQWLLHSLAFRGVRTLLYSFPRVTSSSSSIQASLLIHWLSNTEFPMKINKSGNLLQYSQPNKIFACQVCVNLCNS